MKNKIKRPISVWIAQTILVIFALLFILTLLFALMATIFSPKFSVVGAIITWFINILLVTLFLSSVWGMGQRKRYGRWLGVGMLSIILVFFTFSQMVQPAGPVEYYEYDNAAQRLGGLIAQVVFFGLFLWLILHLSFSKKVKAFFATTSTTLSSDPPPPPNFDEQ